MAGGSYRKLPRYAALAPLLQGRRVLDMGCGDGLGAAFLASGRVTDVLGLDGDAGVARAAHRSFGRPGLSFQHGAPTELPVGDGEMDAVLWLGGAKLPDEAAVFDEVQRVLAPGGIFVASLENPARRLLPLDGGEGTGHLESSGLALCARLARRFPQVRLLGQQPSLGYLFSDLSLPEASREGPSLDPVLLGGGLEELEAWIAVCWSGDEPRLDFPARLVQLSYDALAKILGEAAQLQQQQLEELVDRRGQLKAVLSREEQLEAALRELEERGQRDSAAVAGERAELERRAVELQREGEGFEARQQELEAEVKLSQEAALALEATLARAQDELRREQKVKEETLRQLNDLSIIHAETVAELAGKAHRLHALEERATLAESEEGETGEGSPAERAYRAATERVDTLAHELLAREEQIAQLQIELEAQRALEFLGMGEAQPEEAE